MSEPTKKEPIMLVCFPVSAMKDPVRGSTIVHCQRCNRPVWLSPSSTPIVHYALIACPVCAGAEGAKALERGEPLRFGGFLPGQLDELKSEGVLDE